jgi:hypothetical protein
MKKVIITTLSICASLALVAYVLYYFYFPQIIANAIVTDELPGYIPRRILNHIDHYRIPINKGSEDLVREIHLAKIPMQKILSAIDATSEDEAYNLLDDLNATSVKNTDQVFDIIKKHFDTDFDVEVFRKPFTENVDMKMVRKGMKYANTNRKTKDVDVETARAIIKQVLINKEKELKQRSDSTRQSGAIPGT